MRYFQAHSILLFAMFQSGYSLAQATDGDVLASWVALDAPTGHEHWAIDALQKAFPDWQRDRYGNLSRTIGQGSPHRVVACGLDAYAYSISQITDDGYLRVHRIGAGSSHPLWDQAHEGQHLRVLTDEGPQVVVSAVTNGHFAAQHQHDTAMVTQNDLWLDAGVESAQEVAELGISLLNPVLRNLPEWTFADEVAGPRAGARVSCAAVFAAGEAGLNGPQGSTSYVLSVQQVFGWTGLAAALRWLPHADSLILMTPGDPQAKNIVAPGIGGNLEVIISARGIASVREITPMVASPDALMERITLTSAHDLLRALVNVIDPGAPIPSWIAAPPPASVINNEADRLGPHPTRARLQALEQRLDGFAELMGVPRHEGVVRQKVFEALPAWAKERATIDAIGNLVVEFGADAGEATVFIAHMDEVGWEITHIAPDGTLSLRALGGVVTTAWEGQLAMLQVDSGIESQSSATPSYLKGVFLQRSDPETKRPETVQAWFGMDADALAAAGVTVGMGITMLKEGHHMGKYRYASRSMDDRVGVTALLTAINEIDPNQVQSPMVYAWSVQEEGGLLGAGELAMRYGDRARRAYSIDTFVSSQTPLESPHFAFAPLGNGPVLRSIENGSMATPYELQRNIAVADSMNAPYQIGHTQGGTDGTRFTFFGAPNAGLSWPGRYSHSPAEIADLRDIAGLVSLIKAMTLATLELP